MAGFLLQAKDIADSNEVLIVYPFHMPLQPDNVR